MDVAGREVEHPPWCDRTLCTAAERHPTLDEQRQQELGAAGKHVSAPIVMEGASGYQAQFTCVIAPWETGTHVRLTSTYPDMNLPRGEALEWFTKVAAALQADEEYTRAKIEARWAAEREDKLSSG